MGLKFKCFRNLARSKMDPKARTNRLENLFLNGKGKLYTGVNVDMLTSLHNFLYGQLDELNADQHSKLEFMLQVFPLLKKFMEIPVWKNHFSEVGNGGTLLLIYREFEDFSRSFSADLLNQMQYDELKKTLSSSGFPVLLTDLPGFFKTNLNDKLEQLTN